MEAATHSHEHGPAIELNPAGWRDGTIRTDVTTRDIIVLGALLRFRHQLTHARKRRSIVRNAQLPVRIDLPADRFDCLAHPFRIDIVARHDHRNQRL